jgi:hypothetical protein
MDIIDAANLAGISLKKVAATKGGEYAGPCPGCGGTDRFRVWPADREGEGSYWCRGCNQSGDLVQFLVDFLNYEYPAAFREAGRSVDYRSKKYRPAELCRTSADVAGRVFEPKIHEDPVETWQLRAEAFVSRAHQTLLHYDNAVKYLAGRGIGERVVRNFRLGWFEGEKGKNCMYRPRQSWGLQRLKNEKTGRDKMLWLPRGFVIPCYRDGRIHRIRIRRPAADIQNPDKDIKYYIVPGSGMEVMGINLDKKTIVVVESELDGMVIARHTWQKAGVVALGSAANKPGASVFFHLKKALRILVALDYDEAGRQAWKWWQKNFETARLWPVPEGKDPGEAVAAGVDIKQWVWAGLPASELMNDQAAKDYNPPAGLTPFQELQFLLKKFPQVELHADQHEARVVFSDGLKNRGIRSRIETLFFEDDEIHWYYRLYHPDKIITGKNC